MSSFCMCKALQNWDSAHQVSRERTEQAILALPSAWRLLLQIRWQCVYTCYTISICIVAEYFEIEMQELWKYLVLLSKLSVWGLSIPEQSGPSTESEDVST